jgi:hypothetical protein
MQRRSVEGSGMNVNTSSEGLVPAPARQLPLVGCSENLVGPQPVTMQPEGALRYNGQLVHKTIRSKR